MPCIVVGVLKYGAFIFLIAQFIKENCEISYVLAPLLMNNKVNHGASFLKTQDNWYDFDKRDSTQGPRSAGASMSPALIGPLNCFVYLFNRYFLITHCIRCFRT